MAYTANAGVPQHTSAKIKTPDVPRYTATPSPQLGKPPKAPPLPDGSPNGLLARGWSGKPEDLLDAVASWHAEEAAYAENHDRSTR